MQLLHLVLQVVMSKIKGNRQQQLPCAQHKLLLLLQVCARNVEEEDEEQQRRYLELEQHRDRQQRLPKEATGGSKTKSKSGKEKDGRPKEPKKTQITVSNDSTPAPGSAVLAAPRPAAFLI